MDIKYYIISYIRDLRRGENRNVGLLMITPNLYLTGFLGRYEEGTLDKEILKELGVDAEVYWSWINYYDKEVSKGTLDSSIERRRLKSNSFIEKPGTLFNVEEPEEDVFRRLFKELVT